MKYWAFRGVALSLTLSSIRDGRSFSTCSNHVIFSLSRPSSSYLPTYHHFHHRQKDNIIHHSPFIFTVYSQRQRYTYFIAYQPSLYISKTTNIKFPRFSTMPLHFSSFQTRTVAVAEQTATAAMPTMTPSNNLTHGDNIGLHKFNPFHNFNNAEFLPSRYLFMLVQFFLLMIVGVLLMGLALCVIRYRAGVFRRVNRFLRTWWREIVWRFRTLNRSRILGQERNTAYIRRPGMREREGSV